MEAGLREPTRGHPGRAVTRQAVGQTEGPAWEHPPGVLKRRRSRRLLKRPPKGLREAVEGPQQL